MGLNVVNADNDVVNLTSRYGKAGYVVVAVVGFILLRKFIHFMKTKRKGGKFLGLF